METVSKLFKFKWILYVIEIKVTIPKELHDREGDSAYERFLPTADFTSNGKVIQ